MKSLFLFMVIIVASVKSQESQYAGYNEIEICNISEGFIISMTGCFPCLTVMPNNIFRYKQCNPGDSSQIFRLNEVSKPLFNLISKTNNNLIKDNCSVSSTSYRNFEIYQVGRNSHLIMDEFSDLCLTASTYNSDITCENLFQTCGTHGSYPITQLFKISRFTDFSHLIFEITGYFSAAGAIITNSSQYITSFVFTSSGKTFTPVVGDLGNGNTYYTIKLPVGTYTSSISVDITKYTIPAQKTLTITECKINNTDYNADITLAKVAQITKIAPIMINDAPGNFSSACSGRCMTHLTHGGNGQRSEVIAGADSTKIFQVRTQVTCNRAVCEIWLGICDSTEAGYVAGNSIGHGRKFVAYWYTWTTGNVIYRKGYSDSAKNGTDKTCTTGMIITTTINLTNNKIKWELDGHLISENDFNPPNLSNLTFCIDHEYTNTTTENLSP